VFDSQIEEENFGIIRIESGSVVERRTDMSLGSQYLSEIRREGKEMIVVKEGAGKFAKKKSSFNLLSNVRWLNKVLSLIESVVQQQDTTLFLLGLQ
jgi:hypothetical protein